VRGVATLPMGERSVLVTGVADPASWALGLRAIAPPGVVDVVPGAETVLVTCRDSRALGDVRDVLAGVVPLSPGDTDGAGEVTLDVRYDGADLAEVATATGLTVDAVIRLHCGAEYVAAFCGFSPGFAYLRGLPPELHLRRRATPRTRVPAGAVAIASEYAAVYPRESPGGWHLLGTTDAVLFDPAIEPPATIQPGARVRFRPITP